MTEQKLDDILDVSVAVVIAVAVLAALVLGCATSSPRTSTTTERVFVTVPVPCMDEPPALFVPDWPPPDKLGNVLFHWSTVEKTREALIGYRRYIDEQVAKCKDRALDHEMRTQEMP